MKNLLEENCGLERDGRMWSIVNNDSGESQQASEMVDGLTITIELRN